MSGQGRRARRQLSTSEQHRLDPMNPIIAAHPAPQGKDPEKAEALKAKRQTFRRLITQLMLIAALKLRGTLGVPKRAAESDANAVESPLASSTNVSGWDLPAWLIVAQTHPLFTQKDIEVRRGRAVERST